MSSMIIGANVKKARLAKGFSQEELARMLGVSVFTVSRLERGAVRRISVNKLHTIADALNVDLSVLLEGADA